VNVSRTRRGWTGSSIATICDFLRSLTGGATKDGRVLSGAHSALLDKAHGHLVEAQRCMDTVIQAHEGNLADRSGTVDEPETADPMPMKGTSGTKSHNRWIFPRGR
jgi:hypothetical protein